MSRLPKPLMVVALGTAVGSLGAWFAATPTPAPQVAEPTPELACSFVRGERRAYEVSSQAGTTEAIRKRIRVSTPRCVAKPASAPRRNPHVRTLDRCPSHVDDAVSMALA